MVELDRSFSITKMMKKKVHVHFMGIGGSGMSAVASIALAYGFKVSGCDLEGSTIYTKHLEKRGVKIFKDHNVSHLKNVDILAVTPAVFDLSPDHPELVKAQKTKTVLTWQEFMGKFLQKDKFVLCVTGTHGKTTTTAMLGLVLEEAGFDPTVEVGAIIPKWGTNFRIGKSDYFVCEADEFNDNFLNYHPNLIILTNIEMDHPEYFQDYDDVVESFVNFIQGSKKEGILVACEDDKGVRKLLKTELKDWSGRVIKYSLSAWEKEKIPLKLMGVHNQRNVLGVMAACQALGIKKEAVGKALENFTGVGRRMELIAEVKGVKVFDDYAHHPTQVAVTLQGAREAFPKARIWAVFQPHMYSRTKTLLNEFRNAFASADQVVVVDIYASREVKDKNRQTIHSKDVAEIIKNPDKKYIGDLKKAAEFLMRRVEKGDVVICMGAGDIYKVSRRLLRSKASNTVNQ